MKSFLCIKVAKGKPMTRAEYHVLRGLLAPLTDAGQDAGYLVERTVNQNETETVWLPLEQFNAIYSTPKDLTFGGAIEAMKRGAKVTRCEWDGRAKKTILRQMKYPCGEVFIGVDGSDSWLPMWHPTNPDMMAHDWRLAD